MASKFAVIEALKCGINAVGAQGRDCSSLLCHAHLKMGVLLHKQATVCSLMSMAVHTRTRQRQQKCKVKFFFLFKIKLVSILRKSHLYCFEIYESIWKWLCCIYIFAIAAQCIFAQHISKAHQFYLSLTRVVLILEFLGAPKKFYVNKGANLLLAHLKIFF